MSGIRQTLSLSLSLVDAIKNMEVFMKHFSFLMLAS
jgi:hypothetical protein